MARLIKYSGYGNAAGLLARRGLMAAGGSREDRTLAGEAGGSGEDSSEESETDEYSELKNRFLFSHPLLHLIF